MNKLVIGIIAFVILLGGAFYVFSNLPGPYDDFAKCIDSKGAKFYGAFWCPHCKEQKELFRTSVKYLPYVECSTPDGQGQLPLCTDAGIKGYPTWIFADGSKSSTVMTLQELADKTSCTLPKLA